MNKTTLGLLGLIVMAMLLGVGGYAFKTTKESRDLRHQLEDLKKNPEQVSQAELKLVVAEVGKLIELPAGEEPTLATITDKEKLSDLSFFAKAANDDKVLIYVTARKAILYRPSQHKIIEVATVNLAASPAPEADFSPTVVLRNGTTTTGLTKSFEETLKQAVPKIQILSRDNAKQTHYTQTLVVDLSGVKPEDAQRLAQIAGATVGSLPDGEAKPDKAEFLIILGNKEATNAPSPSSTSQP